jgi:putative salt-induced outer membrane protein YdiY
MRKVVVRVSLLLTVALATHANFVQAQTQPPAPPAAPAPPAPPEAWTGSAGLGLSLNRGNTATTNLNASFEAAQNPTLTSVWKFKGLYLRGTTEGKLAVDRLFLNARNEHSFSTRVYGFGDVQFLEDQFKQIDYLFAPSAGVGYKLVVTPRTSFNVDGGLGFKVEKNPNFDRRNDAVITASDKFEHKLTTTSSVTQSFGALWKAQDFGDALYTFTAGVAAGLTARTQVKVELLDTYSTRPPNPDVKNNDVALLTAFVYKF